MISPRIIMYVGLGALAWTFLRRYLQRHNEGPQHAPIVEDDVVPGIDRRGDDAVCHLSLSADEARSGKLVDVPSIDGAQRVQVPAGIKNGVRLRIAGLGFRRNDGKRGDQYVVVSIAR
jgi:DnaJ-class molecular chaperone